jgi:hypothetical protein
VAIAIKRLLAERPEAPVLVFDDLTGAVTDLDLRGDENAVLSRYTAVAEGPVGDDTPEAAAQPRGRGRPRLGVQPREVTLLPRHWDWLAAQPGGASVALRRLVEEARRSRHAIDTARTAREAAYRAMAALAGDLPRFEDASRALFAGDRAAFERLIAAWPKDVGLYLQAFANRAWQAGAAERQGDT